MWMGTASPRSARATPLPGSPGRASMGPRAAQSTSRVWAYAAPSSPRIQDSSVRSTPRRSCTKRTVSASGAMRPVKPPISAAMFVSVARSSVSRPPRASPWYSTTWPRAPPSRIRGRASRCSTRSLADTPGCRRPFRRTRSVGGTVTRTSPVTQALAMSVVPTPKARQPRAPAWGVCESVPTTTWPGRA